MPVDTEIRLADGDHVVKFYADEDDLRGAAGGYLGGAVRDGDTAIVIATAEHCRAVEAALAAHGVDPDAARADGRLVVLDAAATLDLFMVDGLPDPARFDEVVGTVVRAAALRRGHVRAYGEMVALLWDEGMVSGAIELERLWNRLCEATPFSLFCSYPVQSVGAVDAADAFSSVCHLHSRVVSGAPALAASDVTRRFAATPQAPRLARRFVAETLQEWDLLALADDAVLVLAELTANAVRHAASDVTVGLTRHEGRVRIDVGDASDTPPVPRDAGPTDVGGRGLLLVDRLSRAWGHRLVAGGKVVWADIAAGRAAGWA